MIQTGDKLIAEREAGLTYKSIAFKYELPIGTVKSRINRYKAKLLRLQWEKEYNEAKAEGFKGVS